MSRATSCFRHWIALRLIGLAVLPLMLAGCGGFVVDGGIFPLPVIHIVFPLPNQLGVAYENVEIESSNGQIIRGWFIPAEGARATVLIHHGALINRSSLTNHYVLLHDLGYHVFVYDYQGFGESQSFATLSTILPDADAALATLQARTDPGTENIILFGQSMGTLPTMAQALREPDGVLGIILEGSFVPIELPPFTFLFLGIVPSPEAIQNIPTQLDPRLNIAKVNLPKLFLQSTEDNTTPYAGARELYELAPPPKQFIEVRGEHLDAVRIDAAYRDGVRAYLEQLTRDLP